MIPAPRSVAVGLPYFPHSSPSPLLQAWYARTHEGALPYRLFALSNFASMLALLTYPFVVEPNLASRTQGLVWSGGFVCFAVICGFTAWRTSRQAAVYPKRTESAGELPESAPGWTLRLVWLGLA